MYLAYSSHWVSNDCLFKDFQDNDCEFKVFPEDARFTALYQLGKSYGKEKMNLFHLFSSGHMAGTNFSNLLKLTMAMWLHLTKKIQSGSNLCDLWVENRKRQCMISHVLFLCHGEKKYPRWCSLYEPQPQSKGIMQEISHLEIQMYHGWKTQLCYFNSLRFSVKVA